MLGPGAVLWVSAHEPRPVRGLQRHGHLACAGARSLERVRSRSAHRSQPHHHRRRRQPQVHTSNIHFYTVRLETIRTCFVGSFLGSRQNENESKVNIFLYVCLCILEKYQSLLKNYLHYRNKTLWMW